MSRADLYFAICWLSCYLLLFAEIESQYLLLTTLIQSTKNVEQTLKAVSDAVVRSASGSKKAEVACRMFVDFPSECDQVGTLIACVSHAVLPTSTTYFLRRRASDPTHSPPSSSCLPPTRPLSCLTSPSLVHGSPQLFLSGISLRARRHPG